MKQGTVQERLVGVRRYFDEIDADNKEYLTPQEFRKLAFSLGIELSDSELQEAILKIDEDGNGQIDRCNSHKLPLFGFSTVRIDDLPRQARGETHFKEGEFVCIQKGDGRSCTYSGQH